MSIKRYRKEAHIMEGEVIAAVTEGSTGTTFKEFFSRLVKAFGSASSKVLAALANANLLTLIKFGIMIGVSIITVRMFFKYLRNRRKLYSNQENMSVVDRALELNYADIRNQQELHPLMQKVKKNLRKGLTSRKDTKDHPRKGKKYEGYLEKLGKRSRVSRLLNDIDEYMDYEESNEVYRGGNLADVWRFG